MTLKIKDPGSAITHYSAMLLSIFAAIPLFYKTAYSPTPEKLFAFTIFALSMFMLYLASTVYHTFDISPKINLLLKKIDHMMIFFLIAGSYTPICLISLGNKTGFIMLAAVWGIAIAGMLMNLFWINCPKFVSSIIYISMGWICVFAFLKIKEALSNSAFAFLLVGGIIYTIGGIIYAMKLPVFKKLPKYFGNHEIFHCFVIGGSVCHYIVMYLIA